MPEMPQISWECSSLETHPVSFLPAYRITGTVPERGDFADYHFIIPFDEWNHVRDQEMLLMSAVRYIEVRLMKRLGYL